MTAEVGVQRDGRVTRVTIERPADQNRLTLEVLRELQRIVDGLAGNEDTQALIMTGAGVEF